MRKIHLALMFLPFLAACVDHVSDDEGELRVLFADNPQLNTRSEIELPDTNDFILKISNAEGEVVYEGLYGDFPESMSLAKGSYTVGIASCEFTKPAFSTPLFGDEQCINIPEGGVADVVLQCVQMNCGVRLRISPTFLTSYPNGALLLKSEDGSLMYSYSVKRIAYFHPGKISLVLTNDGVDEVLMSRYLEAKEMLSLGVSVADTDDKPYSSISVS